MDKKIIKGKSGVAFFEYTSCSQRYKVLEIDGKVSYKKKKGFATEEEAVKSYYKYEEEFKEAYRKYYVTTDKNIMFKDYLIYWFENIYTPRIKSSTKMISAYIVYDLIIPYIDYDVKLKLVTTDYINEILEKVAKLTPHAGNCANTIISIAFKDAMNSGFITYNPAIKMKKYGRPKAKVRVLSEKQLERFINYAKNTSWYLEILITLFCGLRKGELLGLKFNDFDIEDRTLLITRQLCVDYELDNESSHIRSRKLVEKPPKTSNGKRKLKVPEIIIEELVKRKNEVDTNKCLLKNKYNDNDYVSCNKKGNAHNMSGLNSCITSICNKLSLPHITVHSLRHMCATILLEQGAKLAKVSAYLGHESVHTTFEYSCEVMDEKDKILNFMNNLFYPEGGIINAV